MCGSLISQAQDQIADTQRYAQIIATDVRVQGRGYDAIYAELIRKNKPPLDAYYATYMYGRGFELGHYYYSIRAITRQEPTDNYATYFAHLKEYQEGDRNKHLWGWYQQGYMEGQLKAQSAAQRQEQLDPSKTPPVSTNDIGSYQRSLGIDPSDPWSDLRVREVITGPK